MAEDRRRVVHEPLGKDQRQAGGVESLPVTIVVGTLDTRQLIAVQAEPLRQPLAPRHERALRMLVVPHRCVRIEERSQRCVQLGPRISIPILGEEERWREYRAVPVVRQPLGVVMEQGQPLRILVEDLAIGALDQRIDERR